MLNTPINQQTPIEELNLTVRQFNTLKRGGYNTVGDITQGTVKNLVKVRNMGMRDLTSILLRLDHYDFRCSDCSHEEYPDLRSCVETVIDKAVKQARDERPRAWNYGKKKDPQLFHSNIITSAAGLVIPNVDTSSETMFMIKTDDSFHLSKYKVRPGDLMIFDTALQPVPENLVCYRSKDDLYFSSSPIDGFEPYGSLVAVISYRGV